MNKRVASLAIVLAMLGTFVFGTMRTSAQPPENVQLGGAAGLIAAVVQVSDTEVIEVEIEDSLNNLRALNNILNNSPILSNNDIDVTVGDVNVIQDVLNDLEVDIDITDVLNDNDIDVDAVVAVALVYIEDVLSGVIILV